MASRTLTLKKVCIFGAGAIGRYVEAILAHGGAAVSVIVRGPHLAAVRENGLTLRFADRETVTRLNASADLADFGPQDYVIVALKSHHAWELAEALAPLLGPETAVVTMQNGVPWSNFYGIAGQYADLRIKRIDPDDRQLRAIGATVFFGHRDRLARRYSAYLWRMVRARRTQSGSLAALDAGVYPDIRNDIWLELSGNRCFNPVLALTYATLDLVATDPGTRNQSRNMMLEAECIGRRLGAHFRVDVERRINGAARVGAHRTLIQ